MLLRASLIWLPMNALLLWGQVWVLRAAPRSSLGEFLVVMGTVTGIGMIAWYALPWITRDRSDTSVTPVAALWTTSTLASQLVLAATSFGSWSMAAYAFTVGGLLNVSNLSMALMLGLPILAAYMRHRPENRPHEPIPAAESPRKDLVVATAHSS